MSENISRCEKYQVWKGQNNFPTQSPTRGERGNPQSGMEGGFCKIFGYNCNGPLTSNHQCDSESDDEDDEEEQVAPKGKILDAVQHLQEGEAMYKMLLQINASNPFMKKNSD